MFQQICCVVRLLCTTRRVCVVCVFLYGMCVCVRHYCLVRTSESVRWLLSIQFQLLHIYEWQKNKCNFLAFRSLHFMDCGKCRVLIQFSYILCNQLTNVHTCFKHPQNDKLKYFSANIHAIIHCVDLQVELCECVLANWNNIQKINTL